MWVLSVDGPPAGAAGVFMLIDGGRYTLNFSAATAACLSLNVTMATRAQMERAVQQGLETCKFGWIHERIAVVPRLKSDHNCGQGKTGLVLWFAAEDKKFAVYCFRASDLEETPQTSTSQPQTFMFSTRRAAPTQTSAPTAPLTSAPPTAATAPTLLLGATRSHGTAPAPEPPSTHVPAPEPPSTHVPAPEPPSTHVPAPEPPSTHVPAPEPPSTHAPAPEPPSTHVPAPEPPSTHVPAPEPPSTHVPAPEPPSTHVPAPEPPSTHVPAPEPPSTHAPAPEPPSTHVPASLRFFSSRPVSSAAGVRPQPVNSAERSSAALLSGLVVGGVVLLLLTAAAAWLHKRRVWAWSQPAQREATEMWKHMDDGMDVSQSEEEEEEEEEEEALDRRFSSEVQLCVNPRIQTE
ncbi:lymphatic vessel endothelial hyaluronic receptor 1b isoform X2 [Betta splendens]|uniref:Lymphatic vessel endothelial hyaluronic receptor 1b isoform X2 n=1 Tax=Betta splendens TaxID=158456 RepID=A0A9W2XW90_BETSP|nr:lymphatic vessel endothelial hyaluronic receptor 1b isoform X2 [Betta splendens]